MKRESLLVLVSLALFACQDAERVRRSEVSLQEHERPCLRIESEVEFRECVAGTWLDHSGAVLTEVSSDGTVIRTVEATSFVLRGLFEVRTHRHVTTGNIVFTLGGVLSGRVRAECTYWLAGITLKEACNFNRPVDSLPAVTVEFWYDRIEQ